MKHRGASSQVEDMTRIHAVDETAAIVVARPSDWTPARSHRLKNPEDIARSRDYEIAKQVADIVNTI